MPLTEYTHDETGNHWIIETPNPEFTGRRLGVTFVDGEGRTTYIEKAKEFCEVYDYTVVPYTGAPSWDQPVSYDEETGERPAWEEESNPKVTLEAPLERPEGQLKPRKVKDEIAEEKAFSRAVPSA